MSKLTRSSKTFTMYMFIQISNFIDSHLSEQHYAREKDLALDLCMYVYMYVYMYVFFFLYIQFTLFPTKNLQLQGTYISKRTWDPSQKAITK